MKYYTIAVSDTFHAGLVDALKQMAVEDIGLGTSLEGQVQDSDDAKSGPVKVHASGESFEQELQAVRGVVDEVVDLATSMGEEIASLQSMRREVEVLSTTMADAEALKDLSERFEPIQRAQAENEVVQAMRGELDAISPKLDVAVRYLDRLRRASLFAGIGVGVAIMYQIFLAFGSGLVAIVALCAFVAAAFILTEWQFKQLSEFL